MRKYTLTIGTLAAVTVAFLSSFGSNFFNAMNELLIVTGWCKSAEYSCFVRYNIVFIIIVLAIVFSIDYVRIHYLEWKKVTFSIWAPSYISFRIIGGIKINNGKDEALEECTAELMGWEDDFYRKNKIQSFSNAISDSILPCKLFWFEDQNLKQSTSIGRNKEGYIVIFYPTDPKPVGVQDFPYEIRCTAGKFGNMIRSGYYDVRISAKSLKPIIKRIRIEIGENNLLIKEVVDAKGIKTH